MGGRATHARQPTRIRAGALAGLTAPALALALGLAAGAAAAAEPPEVRVLLHRGPGPVRVAGAALQAGPGVVLRNGRPAGHRLAWPGPVEVEGIRYRGRVVAWVQPGDGLVLVNEVPVDRYVEGTLLREVYPAWGRAVLRAQAVVARTYALHRRAGGRARAAGWDLTAEADSQVYGGVEAEATAARQAVADTRGQVLVWQGEPILAAYHSASGGRTASAAEVWGREVPYLVSVAVEGEERSPATYWRIPVSAATLGRALAEQGRPVGPVREVQVLERSASGRVRRVALRGARGSAELGGRDLRRAAGGLPSTLFQVRPADGGFVFVGSGHGHGVGMSQWGAHAMAERGATYREILRWFYPGTELRGAWGAGGEG